MSRPLDILVVANSLFNLIVLFYLIKTKVISRLSFEWETTYHEHLPYGFSVVWWRRPKDLGVSNDGWTIIRLRWLSTETVDRIENEERKNRSFTQTRDEESEVYRSIRNDAVDSFSLVWLYSRIEDDQDSLQTTSATQSWE